MNDTGKHSAASARKPMTWADVARLPEIYLNLGGRDNCHPRPGYENYVAVDLNPMGEWAVQHDLRQPIPLPDGSVSRIHTEDFIEHIRPEEIQRLLAECHRLLKPGGLMRIACPDYNNPKDRDAFAWGGGHDIRNPLHITRTDYPMVKALLAASPFKDYRFYHYWDGDRFVQEPIDYSLGMVRRTPDNDSRCRRPTPLKKLRGAVSDAWFRLARRGRYTEAEFLARKGHRLYVTSLVVDLRR